MVMTTSAARTDSCVRGFGNSCERSMPDSRITSSTAGLIRSAGSDPAVRTSTRPAALCLGRPAAIWLRPALWTQTNRTSGLSSAMSTFRRPRPRSADGCVRRTGPNAFEAPQLLAQLGDELRVGNHPAEHLKVLVPQCYANVDRRL